MQPDPISMDILSQAVIADYLDLTDIDNQVYNQQSSSFQKTTGLICYIRGYFLENGFQIAAQPQKALQYYIHGVLEYLDPLCAFKIYSLSQKKNDVSKIQVTEHIQFAQNEASEIQDLLKNYNRGINEMQQSLSTELRDCPAKQAGEILLTLIVFNQNPNQQRYDNVLEKYVKQSQASVETRTVVYSILLNLMSDSTINLNKRPQQMISLINTLSHKIHKHFSDQLSANFGLMSMIKQRNVIFTSQLVTLFEHVFVQQILNKKENLKFNVGELTQLLLQPPISNDDIKQNVLFIRMLAKQISVDSTQKAFEMQKEELKIQSDSPLCFYYLGKLQHKLGGLDRNDECYQCKCSNMIIKILLSTQDVYQKFVYMYFQVKNEIVHEHQNTKIDDLYVLDIESIYDTHSDQFDKINTFQFLKLRGKVQKLRKKLKERNILLEQQMQITLVINQRKFFNQQPVQSNSPSPIKLYKQGPGIASITSNDSSMIGQSQISCLASEYTQNIMIDPYQLQFQNQLKFIHINDIESVFLRKGNRAGELYTVTIKGQCFTMKQFTLVITQDLQKFFQSQVSLNKLDHRHLRKIYGYSISNYKRLDQNYKTASLNLIYNRYQCNLQEYLLMNKLNLKQKINMMVKISDCILYLHKNGVQSSNIKPCNILMSENEPYISDWDIQIIEQELESTYPFTAPETCGQKDNQCDIWSLGMIYLYIIHNTIWTRPLLDLKLKGNLNLSQIQQVDLYVLEYLKLDLSELKDDYNTGEFRILDHLRLLIEGMVVKDSKCRLDLTQILLTLFDLFNQL